MRLEAWRLIKPKHAGEAFSGEGAKLHGGRWNQPGHALVYTAAHASLALLEVLVQLGSMAALSSYVLIRCEFDSDLVEAMRPDQLPRTWRASPIPFEVQDIGDRWVEEERSAVLEVPSTLLPVERNFLLNPAHPDFKQIRVEDAESLTSAPWPAGL